MMSKIDLDRLIVRQTYFIPIKSDDLKGAILKELEAHRKRVHNISAWGISEEHPHSFKFAYDYQHQFVGVRLLTRIKTVTPKQVKEIAEEYEKGGFKTYSDMVMKTRGNVPTELYVIVLKEEENGCLCEAECLPNLYTKIFQLVQDVKDIEIQEAHVHCKRFLKYIFQGGLNATLIPEEKKLPPQTTTRFLVNDLASHKILEKIEPMLDGATGEVLVCGWVGTLLLPKLRVLKEKGINIRIMTHKSLELKGKQGKQDVERAHGELISLLGKENISMNPECHFRVLVVDNKALVGSMDFNATSLTGTHREFAIYTEDPEIVRSIRKYFNQIFTPLKE